MQATAGASLSRDAAHIQGTRRRTAALLLVALVVLTLDQVTKVWAVAALGDGRVIEVLGEFLQFRLVRNPGAAFSMFTDHTAVLTVIAVVVVSVILWVSRRVTSPVWAVALGGMLGGASGTLSDRLFREPGVMQGHVVDFIELPNWPVFNVADSAIVASAILIALLSLRGVAYSNLHQEDADETDASAGDGHRQHDAEPGKGARIDRETSDGEAAPEARSSTDDDPGTEER